MNKRRIWATSPVYYVMAAVMFIMACFSYTQNKILFAVEITVSGLCLAAVIMTDLHYRVHVYTALRAARKVLSADEQRNLGQFALPLAVLGSAGDIVWTNERFQDLFTENGEGCGDNIAAYIYPKTLRQILSENGTSVSYGDREFTAYGLRTESGSVLYFVDDTYYKQIQRDYREKRTVIAVISFDNREELTRDASGSEDSRITSEVESVLRSWAIDTMEGFLRRMTNGRYMLITDDQHIEEAKTKRFAVLDSVRAVKGENNISATISIGIGRAGVTATESELHARQALEMALGRGADTVEVKKMFANSLDTYKERSQLVAGAEVYKGCAIACSNWEFPNVRIAAAQAADELLSIQGVRASFVIFRVGNEIAISARSLGDVNVQILLEEFGGGGHLNMAGAQIKNSTTNDVRKALIRVLDEKLSDATKKNN